MKTLHALSLVGLLTGGAIAGGFTGCSSSGGDAPSDVPDTAVTDDSGGVDTNPAIDAPRDTAVKDTGKIGGDTAALVCDKLPLDTAFKCEAPTAAQKGGPPSSDCTEANLQEFANKCLAADLSVPSSCTEFRDAHPACNTCIGNWALDASVIAGKVLPDRDKCWYKVLSETCGTSINCMFKCDEEVCGDCDTSAGSGEDGVNTENQLCVNRERAKGGTKVAKGACYDLATGAALKCLNDNAALTAPCFVSELFSGTGASGRPDLTKLKTQVITFMRGACRDNGDWSKSDFSCSSPPCDSGVTDTGTDSATADAPAEAASDAAAD